jgi:hypothetical protein
VSHICNPSYSGGKDQEASSRQIVQEILSGKNLSHKKGADGVAQVVRASD